MNLKLKSKSLFFREYIIKVDKILSSITLNDNSSNTIWDSKEFNDGVDKLYNLKLNVEDSNFQFSPIGADHARHLVSTEIKSREEENDSHNNN